MTEVQLTSDPAHVLAAARGFLHSRPALHNVILTLLADRAATGQPGRYWIVGDGGDGGGVAGVALQSPLDFSCGITPMADAALDALVPAMAAEAPDLPGVNAEAGAAAAFAGRWCQLRRVPGRPDFGMRLHVLGELHHPVGVAGSLRPATGTDLALITGWAQGFLDETHGGDASASEAARRMLEAGVLSIWEDGGGEPVSCAAAQPPHAGMRRINFVYTPPDRRGRGFAAACVAAVSAQVQAGGNGCMLYTDLANPTSNGVYQRLGYEAVAEALRYSFG